MDDHIIGSLNAAVHDFVHMSNLVNRRTDEYSAHYNNLVARINTLAQNGRGRRARKLRKILNEAKPL